MKIYLRSEMMFYLKILELYIPVGLYPTILQSDMPSAFTTLVYTAYMHDEYSGFLHFLLLISTFWFDTLSKLWILLRNFVYDFNALNCTWICNNPFPVQFNYSLTLCFIMIIIFLVFHLTFELSIFPLQIKTPWSKYQNGAKGSIIIYQTLWVNHLYF